MSKGVLAKSNAELVAHAVTILHMMGADIASSKEARAMLKLAMSPPLLMNVALPAVVAWLNWVMPLVLLVMKALPAVLEPMNTAPLNGAVPPLLAIIAASGVILTAGYILWAIQRVFLGSEYRGPHPEAITPMNGREAAVAITLLAFAILLGVYPGFMLNVMHGSMEQLATSLDTGYQNVAHTVSGTAQAMLQR